MLSLFIKSCIVLIFIFQAVVTTEIAYPLAANTPAITSLIHIRNIIEPYILSSNCFRTSGELQLLYPGICVSVSVPDSVVAHLPFSVSARRRPKVIALPPCSCSVVVVCALSLVPSWVVEGYPRDGIRPCDELFDRYSSGSPESCTLLYSFFSCLCFRQSSIFSVSLDV